VRTVAVRWWRERYRVEKATLSRMRTLGLLLGLAAFYAVLIIGLVWAFGVSGFDLIVDGGVVFAIGNAIYVLVRRVRRARAARVGPP
jgi:hypothetical protein